MESESMVEMFLKDLEDPDMTDWSLIGEIEKSKVFVRNQSADDESYEVKAYSTVDDVSPEVFADFCEDLEFKKTWDPFTADIYQCNETKHVYWEAKYPWPLWNREYVYKTERREFIMDGQPCILFINQTVESELPQKPYTVRCKDYNSIVFITSNTAKENSVLAIGQAKDSPGLRIPDWLINWATKTAMSRAYDAMTFGLECYKEHRKAQLINEEISGQLFHNENLSKISLA